MDKNIRLSIVVVISVLLIVLSSCKTNQKETYMGEYKITDINIFRDTPVWELALAVKKQEIQIIKKILQKEPELVNFQEPRYGASLLFWAIGMEKYNSAEVLLKCGANPNIVSKTHWKTPLFLAAGFSWVDMRAKKDAKYVRLLLRYGADPNQSPLNGSDKSNGVHKFTIATKATPLMCSIGCGIEKTKALVEAGADINYESDSGETATVRALFAGANSTLDGIEYAYYLIVQKKAEVSNPYHISINIEEEIDNKFFLVDMLRDWIYDLGSKEHKMKMEIVEEFARQGVNYWETKIPSDKMSQIKKLYPDTWEDYIKKY